MRWGCPLGCCRHHRTGPRADGHACPCSREHRAGGQQTAQSRALAAGLLVSLSSAWLFLRRQREQRLSFPRWRAGRRIFRFCSAAGPRASGTHFLKKEQFPFPPVSQVHGTTVCDALLPHSPLRVNWEKSKLSPVQRISFLGVELDSVSMTARLTEERSSRGRNVVPLKKFQRVLGHMASAAAVTPLGLLNMRPLQHWLHSRFPRWAWRCGTL